jgi:hypothetical protein
MKKVIAVMTIAGTAVVGVTACSGSDTKTSKTVAPTTTVNTAPTTGPGVTLDKYNQVTAGMTYGQVVDLFGGDPGEKTGDVNDGTNHVQGYTWRQGKSGHAIITFVNGLTYEDRKREAGLT